MSTSMRLFVVLLILVALAIVPVTGESQNITPTNPVTASSDPQYFITIDPIGNHNVTDVFFVNGTTNLPVGDTLLVRGVNGRIPLGRNEGSEIDTVVSVQLGDPGINVWSCNLSPVLWWSWHGGLTRDIEFFSCGDSYVVGIYANRSPNEIKTLSNDFTISSIGSGISPNISQTSNIPVTPTILPSASPVTENTTPIPSTPSVPLSGVASVAAFTTMAIAWSLNKRRRR